MKILDIKTWDLWGWIGASGLVLGALVLALNQALVDAPMLAQLLPTVFSSPILAYIPLALFSVTIFIIAFRAVIGRPVQESGTRVQHGDHRNIVGPFSIPIFEPVSEFKLLPLRFSVDFSAQLPYVEVRFYAVNFLQRTIVLSHVKLALQVHGVPKLELIPLVQDDPRLEPKSPLVITCRRNLTDAEFRAFPEKFGYTSASFELLAKATYENTIIAYGPVSSLVVDGWVIPPKGGLEGTRA
jgi:hypothetical protein